MLRRLALSSSTLRLTPRIQSSVIPPMHLVATRDFAKKAKKSKGGKAPVPPTFDGEESAVDLKKLNQDMDKSLNHFRLELAKLRTGRADPGMLDHLHVEAYGSQVKLKEVGHVAMKGPRQLSITVFDPSMLKGVVASVSASDLNLNPLVDGHTVNIPIPKMSSETRQQMLVQANKTAEKARQSVRNIRKGGMEQVKGAKDSLPEDEVHKQQEMVQQVTDAMILEVNSLFETKSNEISASADDDDDE